MPEPSEPAHYYWLNMPADALHYATPTWGRYGFDDGNETCGACRDGSNHVNPKLQTISCQ